MALEEGEATFTRARLEGLMKSHMSNPTDGFLSPQWKVNGPSELATQAYLTSSANSQPDFNPERIFFPSADEESRLYSSLVDKYISLLPDLTRLDACFFEDFLMFHLRTKCPTDFVLKETTALLQRLPRLPIEFHDSETDKQYVDMRDVYFSHSAKKSWETLKAASFVSTAVLSLALTICSRDEGESGVLPTMFTALAGAVARLINEVIGRSKVPQSFSAELFIFRTYLWNIWQRAIMLRNNDVLRSVLEMGFTINDNEYQKREDYTRDMNKAFEHSLLSRRTNNSSGAGDVDYICGWAYTLFRSNPSVLTMDFRYLFDCFRNIFGTRDARCNQRDDGTFEVCDGSSPLSCQRFYGMTIEDQSAHATFCNGNCRRLYWDEGSYRSMNGGRAVSVVQENQELLTYCSASETTIAISHVWSHGQGGRPERDGTGLNECLHKRYTKMAREHYADSYWIDTACIPENHELRDEAIQNINNIFEASKFTLVCDRDLAEVDVSNNSIESLEHAFAVFLLCDWNVRAWTLLEGMRGRKNIFVLCKNEQVVSLHSILVCLQREGRLDLSILALVMQQLLPAYSYLGDNWEWNPSTFNQPWDDPRWLMKGIMDPIAAATLLSHRHASRQEDDNSDGDIIVIWSLLCTQGAYKRVADLWSKVIVAEGRLVPTGFLISSLPRLSTFKNLSWAPSRPNMPPTPPGSDEQRFPAFQSLGSQVGMIKDGILEAIWLRAIVKSPASAKLKNLKIKNPFTEHASTRTYASSIVSEYLRNYKWGAILRPARENGTSWSRLKDNKDLEITPFIPFEYEGNVDGTLVAVVGSNHKPNSKPEKLGRHWIWLTVIEWDEKIPLPHFNPALVHLV